MGSDYVKKMTGNESPRVALINVGAEKEKGNALVKEAYELLEALKDNGTVNFKGNIEPKDILLGDVDIIVCDGFVGNVILKYSEGFAKSMLSMIKRVLLSSFKSKIGALLSKGAFRKLKKNFDPAEIGGAPLLGLNALVVKAHGNSNAYAVQNAIRQCAAFIDGGVVEKMKDTFKKKETK
jgi:glycerol-3-phosphate acyltransferase PlsX